MQIRDLMTPAPIVATRETAIRTVLDSMIEHNIRHVPIVEDAMVIGMLSQRDMTFLAGALDLFSDLDTSFIDSIIDMPLSRLDEMNMKLEGDVFTVDAGDDVMVAVDILINKPVSALVVTEGPTERVVGILSYVDILRWVRERG
ncbi:MAG: CBS domain-containing protein [Bradymonadaceae bacterium]|nr:CBS domain-containing protein [Lujinxingiaceae bacterium]